MSDALDNIFTTIGDSLYMRSGIACSSFVVLWIWFNAGIKLGDFRWIWSCYNDQIFELGIYQKQNEVTGDESCWWEATAGWSVLAVWWQRWYFDVEIPDLGSYLYRELSHLLMKMGQRNACRLLGLSPKVMFSVCSVMFDSFVTPQTVAHQAPLSMGFPRKECGSR